MAPQTALFSKTLRMAVTAGETGEMLEHSATKKRQCTNFKNSLLLYLPESCHLVITSMCTSARYEIQNADTLLLTRYSISLKEPTVIQIIRLNCPNSASSTVNKPYPRLLLVSLRSAFT